MKLAFIHDHKLIKKNDTYYSTGGLPYTIWNRYFPFFNTIYLITRLDSSDTNNFNPSKYSIASGEKVKVFTVKEYKSLIDLPLRYKKIKSNIQSIISLADIIIIRLPSVLGIIAFREAIKLNKPVGIELVSCSFDTYWYHSNVNGKIIAPIMYLLNKKVCKKADAVAYITNSFLQHRYPTLNKSFSGVANVSIEPVKSSILDFKIKNYDSISQKKEIRIGMIGNLEMKYKNHIAVLKIAKMLINNNICKIHIDFVGAGNKNKLENFVKKMNLDGYVNFVGTLKSGSEINEWLDSLTFYLQPSITEGHGRSVIEAMSRGCIVISSNSGGLVETVDENYRTYYNNINDYVRIIKENIESKEKMKLNSIRNYNFASNFYSAVIEEKRMEFLKYLCSLYKS